MTNFLAVERAVRTAAPHNLLGTVRAALVEHYGATDVELLMADYSLTVLQPVTELPHTAEPLSVYTSPEGRAFGSQEPYGQLASSEGVVDLHLPVTVRGDRLGILSVRIPKDRCTPDAVEELTVVAALLGHEIVVAERDTDLYLQARRASRLTLAAEMQWQLLPGRACTRNEYAIGAQLEPAYAIHGDNFDWATTSETLTLSVTNGMGEGIQASLLTNLAVNALRNARRAGIGIADQAALADQALYAQHRGQEYVSTLLLSFELATGRVQVVDAGSPQLWRQRDKTVERVNFEAQFPLGMFEETEYVAQGFVALPGDRLIFVSDGVYAAATEVGEAYGERTLARAIQAAGLLPAAAVPRAILQELASYLDADADDDALVVCLDWFGRDSRPVGGSPQHGRVSVSQLPQ
ncbi:PP2C family protein-serine/threonine phosphatase [Streptomyces durmitorensis]|uniref:Serine/threonine-protein phosphatase n=1 Tax=Streptomyces durmitorensis TaxID=319947 RepID=A0ABY4PQG4_9ACTN|nr:PP2C family protein-serine/threonine phosphatase [Streptomyces durmitorensis]UQT55360.1 serine/threonine-protein phosphatase [Streptomyces durmitorensis]